MKRALPSLALFLAACGPRWDIPAIAKRECSSVEFMHKANLETAVTVAELKVTARMLPPSALYEAKDALAKASQYDAAKFMESCLSEATKAIKPCAAEYKYGTDSAEQCIERRVKETNLDIEILLATPESAAP